MAVLPESVSSRSVIFPESEMPPPKSAVFPEMVQFVRVAVPAFCNPPAAGEPLLLERVEFFRLSIPLLTMAVPKAWVAVRLEMVAMTLASTVRMLLWVFPSTVTPAAGPVIVVGSDLLLSSSFVPLRVIVLAVAKTVGEKVMVVGEVLLLAFAMALRRLTVPVLGGKI